MALITGQVLLLPLIGIIFVLEVGSDLIQIGLDRYIPLHDGPPVEGALGLPDPGAATCWCGQIGRAHV